MYLCRCVIKKLENFFQRYVKEIRTFNCRVITRFFEKFYSICIEWRKAWWNFTVLTDFSFWGIQQTICSKFERKLRKLYCLIVMIRFSICILRQNDFQELVSFSTTKFLLDNWFWYFFNRGFQVCISELKHFSSIKNAYKWRNLRNTSASWV